LRIAHGPAIASLRLREGHIEAVDALGRVRIEAPPPFAEDALHERRQVEVMLAHDGDHDLLTLSVDPRGLHAPIVIDPLWGVVASMTKGRAQHASTLLSDGRVMVAGGFTVNTTWVTDAEIWDPAKNTWTSTSQLASSLTPAVPAIRFALLSPQSDGTVLAV